MRSLIVGLIVLVSFGATASAQQGTGTVRPSVTNIERPPTLQVAQPLASTTIKLSDGSGAFQGANLVITLMRAYQNGTGAPYLVDGMKLPTGVFERGSAVAIGGGAAQAPLAAGTYKAIFAVSQANKAGKFDVIAGGKTTSCSVAPQLLAQGGQKQFCKSGEVTVSNGQIYIELRVAENPAGIEAVVSEITINRMK